jgi:hypothetical protein
MMGFAMARPVWIGLYLLVAAAGCERAPDASPRTAAAAPAQSPRQVIERIVQARARSAEKELRGLIVAERAEAVVETLAAVDELMTANQALCDYITREVGVGIVPAVDQGRIGRNLDVFSPHVAVVDERIEGDKATVTFTIDGRLPAQHARLKLQERAWRYDPGEGYSAELPAALRRMASGLREALEDLESGRVALADVRRDPAVLIEHVRQCLTPGVALLPRPPKTD